MPYGHEKEEEEELHKEGGAAQCRMQWGAAFSVGLKWRLERLIVRWIPAGGEGVEGTCH